MNLTISDFMIRFFVCNIWIGMIILILSAVKWLLKDHLSGRTQYRLWFLHQGLLSVPFLPLRLLSVPRLFPQLFSWLDWLNRKISSAADTGFSAPPASVRTPFETAGWMNDFALSVSRETPSVIGFLLFGIWIAGILAMILLLARAKKRLDILHDSALPLQNKEVRSLYLSCLKEMNITGKIPLYSTAFLKSPVMVGFFRPRIYLPIHLLAGCNASGCDTSGDHASLRSTPKYNSAGTHPDLQEPLGRSNPDLRSLRYMLLHELQHYRHKDALANHLMNLAGILYWFNPLVRYALKEMRNDREIACDTSVLEMLTENEYEDYGNTLIHFAEKLSLTPFPFAAGISSNMTQMKRRILNIASYEKPSAWKRLYNAALFLLTAALLTGTAPALSAYAGDGDPYYRNFSFEQVSYVDYSALFGDYEGTFVLYDMEHDSWKIHNPEHAALRTSPNSTYKIYDALFGLEEQIITPDHSFIAWDHEVYSIDAWNADQDLASAMKYSVNWYFGTIDEQLGRDTVISYLRQIAYGNEYAAKDSPAYWMESSLKISAIEQVELLTRLYNNSFGFKPEHIHAVKDAIRLAVSEDGTLYGKTGTGRAEGQDVNGWFVGYTENSGHTYFFAVNILADADASGSAASEIALSVLSDMGIWK